MEIVLLVAFLNGKVELLDTQEHAFKNIWECHHAALTLETARDDVAFAECAWEARI